MGFLNSNWLEYSKLNESQRLVYLHLIAFHAKNRKGVVSIDNLCEMIGTISRATIWRAIKVLCERGMVVTRDEACYSKHGKPAKLVRLKSFSLAEVGFETELIGLLGKVEKVRGMDGSDEEKNIQRTMNDAALIYSFLVVNNKHFNIFSVHDHELRKWSGLSGARYFNARRYLVTNYLNGDSFARYPVLHKKHGIDNELVFLFFVINDKKEEIDFLDFPWGLIPTSILLERPIPTNVSRFYSAVSKASIVDESFEHDSKPVPDIYYKPYLEENWEYLREYLFTNAAYIQLQMYLGKKNIPKQSFVDLLVKTVESVFGPQSIEMEAARNLNLLCSLSTDKPASEADRARKLKKEETLNWDVKLHMLLYHQCVLNFPRFIDEVGGLLDAIDVTGFDFRELKMRLSYKSKMPPKKSIE